MLKRNKGRANMTP